jgi:hypothetical protein
MTNLGEVKTETTFITPTKDRPVFMLWCSDYGTHDGRFKEYCIQKSNAGRVLGGRVWGMRYAVAVNELHEMLKENKEALIENYKDSLKFEIRLIDGSLDKWEDDAKEKKVYSITLRQAKQLIF